MACPDDEAHVAENDRISRLSGSDAVLISAMVSGRSLTNAATEAGMSERTARRRLADDDVRAALDEARREIIDSVVCALSASAIRAAKTLDALLDESQRPSVRLGAARSILEFGARMRAEQDLTARLDAVEAHLDLTRGGW